MVNTIKDFVELTEAIEGTDRDNVVGVTGMTGEGKSSFGLNYADERGLMRGEAFDMMKYCILTKSEIRNLFIKKDIERRKFYWIDEGVNVVFKKTHYERDQIKLMQIFDMMRDKNCTVFIMIPNFWDFDSHLISGRFRFWVYISKRGSAYVFKPSGNPFSKDVWNRAKNEKLVEKGQFGKIKNLVGMLSFDATPKERYAEYKKIKDIKRRQAIREESVLELSDVKKFLQIVRYARIQFYYLARREKLFKHGTTDKLMEVLNVNMSQELHNFHKIKDDNLVKQIVNFAFSPMNKYDVDSPKRLLHILNKKMDKGDIE